MRSRPVPRARALVAAVLMAALLLPARDARAESDFTTVGAMGLVATGLGGIALLVGGGFWLAMLCQGPRCGDKDITRKMAIGFTVTGGVLLAAGVPMILLGRKDPEPAQPQATKSPLTATPDGVLFRF